MGDVVDYSWARPAPSELRRRGYTGAIRYLSHETGKNLSARERDALWAEGIACGLVWESSAGRPLDGFAAGADDAREANRQADALGWPDWVPLAYAVDFDPTGRLGTITGYFQGVLSAGGRPVGVYGAYALMESLAQLSHQGRRIECYWQCAGWSGSGEGSGGTIRLDDGSRRRVSRHACLYQDIAETRHAGEDHNHVLGHVAFLYHPDQTVPDQTAHEEEDDMPVETHILVTKAGSQWFEQHGGEPGKQAMFKALNTDQFVRVMSPDEVNGHNGLHAYVTAMGGKSGLHVDGEVDDWVFSDRTLLPRDWPADNTPPTVVSLTPQQVAEMTTKLIEALNLDPAELAELTADVIADRLDN